MSFYFNGCSCLKMQSPKTPACMIKDVGQLPYKEKLNTLRLLGGKQGMLRGEDGPGLIINIVNSFKQ